MSTQLVCDVCGKVDKNCWEISEKWSIGRLILHNKIERKDLCDDCFRELFKKVGIDC